MKFAEVIEGLKEGKVYKRMFADYFITMQKPADIPYEVIQNMTSLCQTAKNILQAVGDFQIHYRNQVLMVNMNDDEPNIATYYIPTWEDIFAEDWMEL